MIDGILGRKLGMTQIFNDKGEAVPVTVIEAGPCVVAQVRTADRDGYEAVQLGYGDIKVKRVSKPLQGHLKGAGRLVRHLREVKSTDLSAHTVGDIINVDIFTPGEKVDIAGTSKGRGFAGVVKRHGFRGGPSTHGQSDRHRAPGSIGSGTTPGRVWKGMRMAGRMGGERVTVQNLEIVEIDVERHLLLVKGSVPGAKNGLLMVHRAAKVAKK